MDGVFTVVGGSDDDRKERSEVSVLFCLFVGGQLFYSFDLSSHCVDDFDLY